MDALKADQPEDGPPETSQESFADIRVTGLRIKDEFAPISLAIVGAVAVGLLLVLLQWGSPVLVPIMAAMYIAALCLPIYGWLLGRGVRKTIALVVMLVVVLLGILGIGLLLYAGVNRLSAGLAEYSSGLTENVASIQATISDAGIASSEVESVLDGDVILSFLSAFLGAILSALGDLIFAVILTAFFLLEVERFFNLAETKLQDRPVFGQAPIIAKTAVTYFGIRTRLNLLTGLGFGICLAILGVDYAPLWGLLAFILSYVPYIGLFTATLPPTILALAEYGTTRALLVIAAAAIINAIIESVLEPAYTGAKLKLSPTVVFASFFFWAWLLGPVGALLSMPITVMLLLALDQHESTRWAARIIGSTRD